jgi:hypothetical protein
MISDIEVTVRDRILIMCNAEMDVFRGTEIHPAQTIKELNVGRTHRPR